jgi:hypothetical protein
MKKTSILQIFSLSMLSAWAFSFGIAAAALMSHVQSALGV